MCSLCGFPDAAGDWMDAGAISVVDKLDARLRRARVLRRVLSAYGVEARDGGLPARIQLAGKSGKVMAVREFGEVWPAAELMAGVAVDPLDPRFTAVSSPAV
jgi:hypothetical protein